MLGALEQSSGLDEDAIDCVQEQRIDVQLARTVDALFECTGVADRRTALIALFGDGLDAVDLAEVGLPQDLDLDAFTGCVADELVTAPDATIDAIWRDATSVAALGELTATTAGRPCFGIVTSALAAGSTVAAADLFDAVVSAAGSDPGDVDPVVVDQNAVVISYIETPVRLAAVSSSDGLSVISAEVRAADPPSAVEIDAMRALLDTFGFDDVDVVSMFGQAPARLATDEHVACFTSDSGETGLRVLPAALDCES